MTGFIISIERVPGEAWAARRRRRPTKRIAEPMIRTERTYAPIMEAICAGRYERSRRAWLSSGGPFPGGGAGASQMLTCQMSVGEAVVAVIKSAWRSGKYETWRRKMENIVRFRSFQGMSG